MRLFNWIELISLNMIGASVATWLLSFMQSWSTIVAGLVGLSVIALNGVKLYGVHLDNLKKKRELEENN